jgi:surface antigen
MPGITSAASLAAQTGPSSVVTTDANGNLAAAPTSGFATAGSVAALDGRVTNLENSVAILQRDVRRGYEGTAVAIAMGTTALPDNKRFAVTANFGTFRGENAFGASAAVRVTDFLVANAAVGTGLARGGVGGRVGATFAW